MASQQYQYDQVRELQQILNSFTEEYQRYKNIRRGISVVDVTMYLVSGVITGTASSTTKKNNVKRVEKRCTLTEIILVAFCCLLLGILLTTLVFSLNMKRRMIVCFSKHIKDIQCDSKQQSGPDMHFPTESCVVKKYYPNKPKSAYLKNKNTAEQSQYQSFNSIQVVNDQQIYDEISVNEPRSDRQGHQSSYSRSQHTGNDYHIDQIPNLQRHHAGVNEHFPDGDIDGHNYFVLEKENMPRESRDRNLGRPETEAEVGDEVNDSTLGKDDKPSDADYEYVHLEQFENGHNQD